MTDMANDFDDLLNDNIDNAPEVPDFVTPPSGFYKLTVTDIKMDKAEDSGQKWVKVYYSIDETVELAKPDAEAVPVGSMFTESFFYTDKEGKQSEIGMGNMKKCFAHIAAHFGVSGWAEIFERAVSLKVSAKVVTKAGKKKNADGNVMYFTNTQGGLELL